jgi:hypothetical protein
MRSAVICPHGVKDLCEEESGKTVAHGIPLCAITSISNLESNERYLIPIPCRKPGLPGFRR